LVLADQLGYARGLVIEGMSELETHDWGDSMGSDHFGTTHWSVVVAAGATTTAKSEAALETLCRVYWYPIYAYVRRRGHPLHEAQDLTQAFFCHFLASECLQTIDRRQGRFRSFLIGSLKHFLANEWDKANRLKRGGGRQILSWDGLDPEERFRHEPAGNVPAEQLLDREWARTMVAEALNKLRGEAAREGTESRFDLLKQFLGGDAGGVSYAAAAESLNLSESAVKSAIHRLRRRFAELFRAEVLQTVSNAEEADAEIRHLFAALGD
jgi:RNA polymerase sigma-70 factor (ECF subfamily)